MAETTLLNGATTPKDKAGSVSEREGVNPQEALTPTIEEEGPKSPAARDDNNVDYETSKISAAGDGVGDTNRKVKKRGRQVWLVDIEEDAVAIPKCSWLPPYQYETDLQRRAIRKKDSIIRPKSPLSASDSSKSDDSRTSKRGDAQVTTSPKNSEERIPVEEQQEVLEQYGDVALGMKLTIVGGKVIVEGLNALSDGRASPAQLTGLIRRGDVLLSVDNVSLVNMPLNQLVEGLKPLSTPLNGTSYQRTLRLRFAAGQGLGVLKKREAQMLKKAASTDTASEMFSLANFMPTDVPMVDNLSGLPILQNSPESTTAMRMRKKSEEPVIATPKRVKSDFLIQKVEHPTGNPQRVAEGHEWEREKLTSNFFASDENCSELLRPPVVSLDSLKGSFEVVFTLAEMLTNGERAIEGAKVLFYNMEDLDKGSDIRSFRKWNSQISLRSRASSRRKHLLETASRGGSNQGSGSSSVASAGSSISEDLDGIDGDDMLLGLAAHDEIWRRQVLETLQQAAEELDSDEQVEADTQAPSARVSTNLDTAISIELGSLLFGAQMSRIITKKKRPLCLPPAEVTSVLFDLTTNLASVMPDEIVSRGSIDGTLHSSLGSFVKPKQINLDRNMILASHFVAEEALPAWLKSFLPLPKEQRRMLWPRSSLDGDSHTISSYSQAFSEDSLTLDSDRTGNLPSYQKKKNLQEKIEDMELDAETREETCYLATVYFTQVLLPKLERIGPDANIKVTIEKDATEFVDKYGVYLKLHTCLVCAAVVEADSVIKSLLRVAKHDPRHKDAMKMLSKTTGLLLYEPTLLSALLRQLRSVRVDKSSENILRLLTLSASAFPDLRPWQVRSALLVDGSEFKLYQLKEGEKTPRDPQFEEFYYHYLSLLMHPFEGHDAARRDSYLVEEFCNMCLEPSDTDAATQKRKQNFFLIASKASSDHQLYNRNLITLLNLSMKSGELNLALELAGEIVQDFALFTDNQLQQEVLPHLRSIARASVNAEISNGRQGIDAPRLQKILALYGEMSKTGGVSRQTIVFSDELYSLLLSSQASKDSESPSDGEIELIEILVESTDPKHLLPMLALWTRSRNVSPYLLTYIRRSLLKGVESGIRSELSGSLLRIKDARKHDGLYEHAVASPNQMKYSVDGDNIWNRMYSGDAFIDK